MEEKFHASGGPKEVSGAVKPFLPQFLSSASFLGNKHRIQNLFPREVQSMPTFECLNSSHLENSRLHNNCFGNYLSSGSSKRPFQAVRFEECSFVSLYSTVER